MFNLIEINKIFYLHIIRNVSIILYKEGLIAITCSWFKLTTSLRVVKKFILEISMDG